MPLCNKQHLNNSWSSIHEKVKKHWGWVEKSVACKEKCVNNFFSLVLFSAVIHKRKWKKPISKTIKYKLDSSSNI